MTRTLLKWWQQVDVMLYDLSGQGIGSAWRMSHWFNCMNYFVRLKKKIVWKI